MRRSGLGNTLCVVASAAVLGGAVLAFLRCKPETKETTAAAVIDPLTYFEETEVRGQAPHPLYFARLRGVRSSPPLALRVDPSRSGRAGLLIRVELWNVSDAEQLVVPLSPYRCTLEFRDAQGDRPEPDPFMMQPGSPVLLDQSEVTRLHRGNCLVAYYRAPHYAARTRRQLGGECRAVLFSAYRGETGRLERTLLYSDWTVIPDS